MKIPFLAASAATIAMLGACSGAPVGVDPSAPSFNVATTTVTTTSTDSTSTTCSTSTDSTTSTTTSTQLSASGTYAVAYGGAVVVVSCDDSP